MSGNVNIVLYHPSDADDVLAAALVVHSLKLKNIKYILVPSYAEDLEKKIRELTIDKRIKVIHFIGIPLNYVEEIEFFVNILKEHPYIELWVYTKRSETEKVFDLFKNKYPTIGNKVKIKVRKQNAEKNRISFFICYDYLERYPNDDVLNSICTSLIFDRDKIRALTSILSYLPAIVNNVVELISEYGEKAFFMKEFKKYLEDSQKLDQELRDIIEKEEYQKHFVGDFILLIEIPPEYPTRRGVDLLSRKFNDKLVFVARRGDNKYFYTYGIGKALKEKLKQYNLYEDLGRYIITQIKNLLDSTIGGRTFRGGGSINNIYSLINVLKRINEYIKRSLTVKHHKERNSSTPIFQ